MDKSKVKYGERKNVLFPFSFTDKGRKKKEKYKEESYFYHEIKQKTECFF